MVCYKCYRKKSSTCENRGSGMKRLGKHIAAFLLLLTMLMTAAPMAVQAGFVKTPDGVKYVTKAGETVTGLKKIGRKVYLFDQNGLMLRGIQRVGAKTYFFDLNTGVRRYGWISYAGAKYYAHRKTGALFINKRKGKYYFGPDGALIKGGAAAAAVGWYHIGSKTYYNNEQHQKLTGMQEIGSRLYYFNDRGVLQKSRLISLNGARYYAGKKGYLLRNCFVKLKGKKYYAQADGSFAKGLVRIGASTYYFRPNGQMYASSRLFSYLGSRYYVYKTGRIAVNRWVKYKKHYYWCDADGRIATNRFIGDYYVGADGIRTRAEKPSSGVVTRNGRTYLFGTNGSPLTNQWLSTSDGKRYYAGGDGGALTGLQIIGGYKFYFDAQGVLQTDSVVFAAGSCYYTDPSDGHIVSESAVSGNAIVRFAQQFVGNRYVYGGTSLTNGADCSGFTQAVMAHFGVRIMRVAVDQMNGASGYYSTIGYAAGMKVSDANLQPGDLVFYGSGSYASHVAIYIGNNQVVHAANSKLGIIISSIDYVRSRLHNQNRRYWAG